MEKIDKNKTVVDEAIDCVSEIRNIFIRADGPAHCSSMKKEDAENIIKNLKDQERIEFINKTLNSKNPEKDVEKLTSHLQNLKNRKQRVQMKRFSIAISAVAASLVLLFLLLDESGVNTIYTPVVSNPTKPTLTSESGVVIHLTDIDKRIETEDYSITKDADAKLEYVAKNDAKEEILSLTVPAGYTYTIRLNDGTEVTLNGGSELSYPTKFGEEVRRVKFNGEAYFKVAKSDVPFIVNSERMYVKVYGTEFNINTQQKNRFETVLVHGSVGIGVIGGEEIKIQPNQMYEYNFETKIETVCDVEVDNYISWLNDSFCYQNRSVEAILADISAWYGVQFTVQKDISVINLTFRIERSTKIDELLLFIESLTDIKFIKEMKGGYSIE